MTIHFVNLVSWSYFIDKDLDESIIFADSITFCLMARLLGLKLKQISGVSSAMQICDKISTGYLLSEDKSIPNSFVLPFWKDLDEITLDNELLNFISKYENIVISISSPKQDKLAMLINKIQLNKNIYCLGAAININKSVKFLEYFNLMWLGFLFSNPIRTFNKIYLTIHSIITVLFSDDIKLNFIRVAKKINSENYFLK
jgi:hypothetical protein